MQPQKKDYTLKIPVTFGFPTEINVTQNKMLHFTILSVLFLISVIFSFVILEGKTLMLYLGGSFIFYVLYSRFVIIRERYYSKLYTKLKSVDNQFSYRVFWDIYDVSLLYPHIAYHSTGRRSIFVFLQKGGIIGQGTSVGFNHAAAVADAYLSAHKLGLGVIHIDYMDSVGGDSRMASLFSLADKAESQDVRKVLTYIFDHVALEMSKSFAVYDVFCFYTEATNMSDTTFVKNVNEVVLELMKANYVGSNIMGRQEIGELVKALMSVETFSTTHLCDEVISGMQNKSNLLREIWVEKDGERKVLNKTIKQENEEKRIQKAEGKVKRKRRFFYRGKKKDDEITIFREDPDNSSRQSKATSSSLELEVETKDKTDELDLF